MVDPNQIGTIEEFNETSKQQGWQLVLTPIKEGIYHWELTKKGEVIAATPSDFDALIVGKLFAKEAQK